MPRKPTKNTAQIAAEIDKDLAERFRWFVRGRGDSVREHLEMAIRRHLANPPPPPQPPPTDPPLPPVVVPPMPPGRGRKPKGGG